MAFSGGIRGFSPSVNLAMFLQKCLGMSQGLDIIQCDPDVPAGVFAEFLAGWQVPFRIRRPDQGEELAASAGAVIVLGGQMGVHDELRYPFLKVLKGYMKRMIAEETPLFGICLGGQLLADVAGGVVSSKRCGEQGLVDIHLSGAGRCDPLFAGIVSTFQAFQWHNDSFAVPLRGVHLAASSACAGQAFRLGRAWGVQFHPEVDAAIVNSWSGKSPVRERLVGDFLLAEQEHRSLARQILGNFLAIAGFRIG